MIATRRNFMWPLIVIAVGGLWLLIVADVFPDAVADLLKRAWPALLILFGYDILLGRRRLSLARWTLDTSLLGVILTVIFVLGVIWFAYNKQGDVVRTENVVTFAEPISDEIEKVHITVDVERTTLTILPTSDDSRTISAEFVGSTGSKVVMDWTTEGATGVLTIREAIPESIPKLDEYGRGTLAIALPTTVIIEPFELTGASGDVELDLSRVFLRQIAVDMDEGDIALYLPRLDTLQGNLKTGDGGIELFVPPNTVLNVQLAGGSGKPRYEYNPLRYDLLATGELKLIDSQGAQYALDVSLKGGALLRIVDLEE